MKPAAATLAVGELVAGKYRLVRPAGFGGMGTVWVARNEATNAEVALKVLSADRALMDEEAALRFRREAHAAAQLYHRGIVRIFDLVELTGPDMGALVLVMELLRGETLASLMDRKRIFTMGEMLSIVLPLLSALAHAHAQGIVHRDVKPENVFLSVDPDGHTIPKVLDFGISKLVHGSAPRITTDGAMLGTPNYMSPEQARGSSDVDARGDVFAAGILIYEMLSGRNPFSNGSYHSVVAAILEREPPKLEGVPDEIWLVIKRALEKPAVLRYSDAAELALALRTASQRVGLSPADASGAFPAHGSFGDRSVPPAPFREPEVTMPSMFRMSQRKAKLRSALVIAAIAGALVAGAMLLARGRAAPAVASPKAVVAPPPTVEDVRAAVPVVPPPPAEPSANVAASSDLPGLTVTPIAAGTSSRGARHAAPSAPKSSKPAPTSPQKPGAMVRDPGF